MYEAVRTHLVPGDEGLPELRRDKRVDKGEVSMAVEKRNCDKRSESTWRSAPRRFAPRAPNEQLSTLTRYQLDSHLATLDTVRRAH